MKKEARAKIPKPFISTGRTGACSIDHGERWARLNAACSTVQSMSTAPVAGSDMHCSDAGDSHACRILYVAAH